MELPNRDEVVRELAKGLSRGYVQRTGSFTQYAENIVRYIEAVLQNQDLPALERATDER